MKYAKFLLLIFLFLLGIGLIWQVGRHVSPPEQDPVPIPQPEAVKSEPEHAAPAADTDKVEVAVPPKPVLPQGGTPRILHTDRGDFIATDPILFNSGLTTLREASIPKLDRIAGFLIRNPAIRIEIVGHTDNLGTEPVNQQVSAERAAIVMNYLVSQGIDPSRLSSKGMGSLDPIESNDTQLGRQANRRIEFLVREGAAEGR